VALRVACAREETYRESGIDESVTRGSLCLNSLQRLLVNCSWTIFSDVMTARLEPLPVGFLDAVTAVVGAAQIRTDDASRQSYGVDALGLVRGIPATAIVFPGSTAEVSAVTRLCHEHHVPVTPRGAGTGYTGGAVPTHGGVVLSLERLNRILAIDPPNLLAVVEPHVVTAVLQEAVERRGLFYPPDPASSRRSVIGGNVAECAGGPRAFKYGTTKRYVLGLEAVLPTGEVIKTGGRTVKNVVGYDLTQLLVGSEGTLAIVTKITLRLIPLPPARTTVRALFSSVRAATEAVGRLVSDRVVPAALELIDKECVEAVRRLYDEPSAVENGPARQHLDIPPDTGAMLLVEVDGFETSVKEESARVTRACSAAGATDVRTALTGEERDRLWEARRGLSLALRSLAPRKINHDVVVPTAAIPQLFEAISEIRATAQLPMPSFGHVGDGNIHVNILVDPADTDAMERAAAAERALFERVVALGGSLSGEHGIGFSKARFLHLELSASTIALMRRLKQAFDPHGVLNPGKIFPDEEA